MSVYIRINYSVSDVGGRLAAARVNPTAQTSAKNSFKMSK